VKITRYYKSVKVILLISLKGRLLRIASMVDHCHTAADIGTDHAYIPIYLVQSGICEKVIATDIRQGPLQKAEKNVEKNKLSEKIELRLGDGIYPVRYGECDVFIIAGLGGVLISEIINASLETLKKAKSLVLQPLYTEGVLREYLMRNGFRIETEALVRDEGRIYAVIKATYDGIIRVDDILYYHIGRALFEKKDPLLREYLERRIRIQTKIVNGMLKSELADGDACRNEQTLLARMREEYDSFFG